jgi:uncharacterized protein
MNGSDPPASLVGFARLLRARGLPVGTDRVLTFVRAVHALAPASRHDVYWAARTSLTARPEDIELFDSAFDDYFGADGLDGTRSTLFDWLDRTAPPPTEIVLEKDHALSLSGFATEGESGDEVSPRMVASAVESLRGKSFDALSDEERAHAHLLIRKLEVALPVRRARRLRSRHRAHDLDLRRTLRHSLRTQGEPFRRAYRARRTKERPLVLVLDVSGSMSAYSRALVQFGYAALRAGRRVEVFCFGTRLTRITRALETKNVDRAMAEVADVVVDWDGGTRIGESLRDLLDDYGQHVSMRRAVVVLCSDGLDRGDPALLERQMGRIARLAYRVIWVNPLKGSPRYQPLARGMAAALPHVDEFLPGHNLASLEHLGDILAR